MWIRAKIVLVREHQHLQQVDAHRQRYLVQSLMSVRTIKAATQLLVGKSLSQLILLT